MVDSQSALVQSEVDVAEMTVRTLLWDYPEVVRLMVIEGVKEAVRRLKSKSADRVLRAAGNGSNDLRIRWAVPEQSSSVRLFNATNNRWDFGAVTAGTDLAAIDGITVAKGHGYVVFGLERLETRNLFSTCIVQIPEVKDAHDIQAWLNTENGRIYFPRTYVAIEDDSLTLTMEVHTTDAAASYFKPLILEILTGSEMQVSPVS